MQAAALNEVEEAMNLPACERETCLLQITECGLPSKRALSRTTTLLRWANALPVERVLSNTADENAEVNELFV